jgi:carbonic anhydrase
MNIYNNNLILTALLTTIIMALVSNQIFLKTSSAAVLQQQQQLKITNNSTNATTATTNSTNIRPNIRTDFNPNVTSPKISKAAYVDPFAVIIGDCEIGKLVLVAPFAVCRGDEGTPIHIGDYSNLQDGVVLHSLETTAHGKNIDDRRYSGLGSLLKANDTRFKNGFAIYIGDKVSLAHDVQVHGPAYVGNDTFVGMTSPNL